ncbi:MAG: type II toxin-antitoxin system Phd/YefM family antitoxin [Coriobacteriia bacterium]|nr:type II toxin-antitoxin system Phd/YefM family antitoxin [Coriobacteriia bacterium]
MVVSATELKQNLSKYIELSNDEEIVVTKNGRPVTYMNGPIKRKLDALNALTGIMSGFNPSPEELAADPRLERILSR